MRKTPGVVVMMAVAAVFLGACGQGGGTEVKPIELEGSGGSSTIAGVEDTAGSQDGGGEAVSDRETIILVDGWSMAGIQQAGLTWGSVDDAAGVAMSFEPAGEEDIKAIIAKDPGAVTNLMARMVTGDPTLTCETSGCRTAEREISYKELIEPQTGKVLGGSYADWGIETGVWIATIPSNMTKIRYGNYAYSVVQPDEEEAGTLGIAPGTGVEALAIAFGRIFPIEAEWLGGAGGYENREYVSASDEQPKYTKAEAFLSGLGMGAPGVESLSSSQLTWRTSPTTGCGVGVLCVPGVAEAELRPSAVKNFKVCQGEKQGWIELGAVDLSYTYKGRTNQFGIWGEEKPTGEIAGRAMIWTTEPPYVQGAVEQHHIYAHLYDGLGLYEKTGRVSTIGVDGPEDTEYVPGEEYLGQVFGGEWKKC